VKLSRSAKLKKVALSLTPFLCLATRVRTKNKATGSDGFSDQKKAAQPGGLNSKSDGR
jgi:hypothetical protein